MKLPKTDRYLLTLLTLNLIFFSLHIYHNCTDIFYFFQLTIIGQILVIINFTLSILLHERKSGPNIRRLLSRLHLMSISLQAVVVVGFWGLRIFFTKGIIKQGQQYTIITQILSIWVHGGSFITLWYFIKIDQIVSQTQKYIKLFTHFIWAIPFAFLQHLKWRLVGEHIYGFIQYFTWAQLIVFELFLFSLAVVIDYLLTLRHGMKLTMKHMNSQKTNLEQLEKQKQLEDARKYQQEQKQIQIEKLKEKEKEKEKSL